MAREWYILHTASGYENKVQSNISKIVQTRGLGDIIYQVKVPTEDVVEMKEGKRKVSKRRFFPGYILLEMDLPDEERLWKEICAVLRRTPGVAGFVGMDMRRKPQPISKEEARLILQRMGAIKSTHEVTPRVTFSVSEVIKVADGPFSGFNGVVEEINADKGRLKVNIEIFGRSTPVDLDFLQVKKL